MKKIFLFTFFLTFVLFTGCTKEKRNKETKRIAVFLPGFRTGNAVYSMLADGAERAVEQANEKGNIAEIIVLEAGTNQAEWGMKLKSIAAEEKYELIISSNPSIPEIIKPILKEFPNQKFMLLDAFFENEPSVATFRYNQREQGFAAGYIAALVSLSKMKYANAEKKIGLIAGQEYPVMTNIIAPAFLEGAKAVDKDFELDFRVVGNWYDSLKGAELASAMHNAGCDVIMPICGAANQGVITAAKEKGFYITWFDNNGYSKAPGLVVGSSVMHQDKLSFEKTLDFLNGNLEFGEALTLGMKDGFVDFITEDKEYISTVPEELRNKQSEMLKKIFNGEINLPIE